LNPSTTVEQRIDAMFERFNNSVDEPKWMLEFIDEEIQHMMAAGWEFSEIVGKLTTWSLTHERNVQTDLFYHTCLNELYVIRHDEQHNR